MLCWIFFFYIVKSQCYPLHPVGGSDKYRVYCCCHLQGREVGVDSCWHCPERAL